MRVTRNARRALLNRTSSRFIALVLGTALALMAAAHRLDRPAPLDRPPAMVRVIVGTDDVSATEHAIAEAGGRIARRLTGARSVVADLPSSALTRLASSGEVRSIHADRPMQGTLERTAATIGARWAAENLGVDGSGIGVAIIDSGVVRGHEDLADKIVHFADFIDSQREPHDGYGHGTHVAGIIAGTGFSSDGARRGIAPGSHLVVLKALDDQGDGFISTAIAAIDYAIEHRAAFNIRVINLSVAAGVYESYKTDPLTLAAHRAVESGIVIVTAAGNLGRNSRGQVQFGGITAPGNAPWVLTVGAATHNGTADRGDDTVAPFSSWGPSAIDLVAKPDLVAPGVGIESTADPGGTLFAARPEARVWGTTPAAFEPYLALSGTSMASPVVAATVALMLQANPSLSPAEVKTLLRSSAEFHTKENRQAQGAGFLNARAAVTLARSFAESPATAAALEDLADASQPEEGSWPAACDLGAMDCRPLTAACSVVPGCVEHVAGFVTSTIIPSAGSTVWGSRDRRPADPGTPGNRIGPRRQQ